MFKLCQRKIALYGVVLVFENNIYCSIPQLFFFLAYIQVNQTKM